MNLIKKLVPLKVYMNRSSSYVSIINFAMLFATFKKTYNINISSFILIPIGFIITLFIGYIDYKFILAKEIQHNNKQNNIKHQLNKIEKKLNTFINK